MKKSVLRSIIVLLLVLTSYNVCFAYSSYGSSNSIGIVVVLWIVFGLLGLILFFKIWGMTNDIKKIKEKFLFLDEEYKKPIDNPLQVEIMKEAVLCGDITFVKKRLIKHFCYAIENNFDKQIDKKLSKQEAKAQKDNLMQQSIRPLVDNLQTLFDRIGEELPPYIKRMETYNDYYNIFTTADFK